MRKMLLCVLLATGAACGGGNTTTFASGSATVTGTIGTQSMTAKDAVSVVVQANSNSAAEILIANFDGVCAKINAHQEPRNAQALVIQVGIRSSQTGIVAPTATGTFPVFPIADSFTQVGVQAVVQFQAVDATCQVTGPTIDAVSGGTVTLTKIDASGYTGAFDVTFATGGAGSHVTGTFSSAQCAPLQNPVFTTCL